MHIALCVHTGFFMKDNASEIYRELSLAVEKQREHRVAFPRASVRYQTSSLFFLKGRLQYIFLVINGFRISYIITCMHLHTSGKDWVLAHAICHYKCSDSFTVYIWMSGLGIQATIMRTYFTVVTEMKYIGFCGRSLYYVFAKVNMVSAQD